MERPAHYGKWGQRGRFQIPYPERGPNGERYCRWCGDVITALRRLTWCTDECVDAYRLRSDWGFLRDSIIRRDKACSECGGHRYVQTRSQQCYWDHLEGVSFCPLRIAWEVDHIQPVAEDGTDDPINLRLLCVPCHKDRTRKWHGVRAAVRRAGQPHTLALDLE